MRKTAYNIVVKLQSTGFKAYFVGGCVRDLLLGIEPKDFDIATEALPEQIEALFEKTYDVGKKFGIILINEGDFNFEIATFRDDGDYHDGRRPTQIHFSTPEKDALRRDFTINGIFYDPCNDEYLDFVGGKKDLKNKILRFIGDPESRIREDFLRIMRAIRFKNRFNLKYENQTGKALKNHAALVTNIAAERLFDELNKIIIHKSRANALEECYEFGILAKLFPEVDDMEWTHQPKDHHMEGDVLSHTFLVLQNMEEGLDPAVYWAAFFHDYAKPSTKKFSDGQWRFPDHDDKVLDLVKPLLKNLKFPKKLADKILWLLRYKQIFETFWNMKLSRRLHYYDHPYFLDLWRLEMADLNGSIPEDQKTKEEAIRVMNLIKDNYQYAHKKGILPSSQPELLTGEEIMKITGLPAGKRIGELKTGLKDLQIEGQITTRKQAEKWLQDQ